MPFNRDILLYRVMTDVLLAMGIRRARRVRPYAHPPGWWRGFLGALAEMDFQTTNFDFTALFHVPPEGLRRVSPDWIRVLKSLILSYANK